MFTKTVSVVISNIQHCIKVVLIGATRKPATSKQPAIVGSCKYELVNSVRVHSLTRWE